MVTRTLLCGVEDGFSKCTRHIIEIDSLIDIWTFSFAVLRNEKYYIGMRRIANNITMYLNDIMSYSFYRQIDKWKI